ncbi:MAG: hypothetical protein U1F66_13520 [bacterium]
MKLRIDRLFAATLTLLFLPALARSQTILKPITNTNLIQTAVTRPAPSTSSNSTTGINFSKFVNVKFTLPPLALSCIASSADAPYKALSTVCRAIGNCVSIPGREITPETAAAFADWCVSDGTAAVTGLWDNMGYHVSDGVLNWLGMKDDISAGRATVNSADFCACMEAISAQSCDFIARAISGPGDYGNFENLVPDGGACERSFSGTH